MREIKIKGKKLEYSSKIECTIDEKGECKLLIKETTANMQEDASDFEGIIIWIWSLDRSITVTLKYNSYDGKNDKNKANHNIKWDKADLKQLCYISDKGIEYPEPARLHHMRFLYRVMRFRERYPNGFELDPSNKDEIDKFEKLYKEALDKGELWITKPTTEAGIRGDGKGLGNNIEDTEVAENHLEKWFVIKSKNKKLPEKIVKVFGNNRLYDQLPCSIFIGKKETSARIFNRGYFDLWGINDKGELCIFELKKAGNNKLGIISELFYYAMIMRDMKRAADGKYKRITTNYRGFKSFVDNENSNVVNAYFLVPELYPSLEEVKDTFIQVLNENDDGVRFELITFSQKEIEDDIDFKKLSKELKQINW